MSLRRIFESEVSSSKFQVIDCETRIVGKFAQISLMDNGLFDIWLIGPGLEPLSTRKISSIIKRFPQEARFTVLAGEAYTQTRDKNIVLKTLSLLGIRKKRRISFETREKLIAQLKAANNPQKVDGGQIVPQPFVKQLSSLAVPLTESQRVHAQFKSDR